MKQGKEESVENGHEVSCVVDAQEQVCHREDPNHNQDFPLVSSF